VRREPPDLRQVARATEQYEARETAGTASQKRVPDYFVSTDFP